VHPAISMVEKTSSKIRDRVVFFIRRHRVRIIIRLNNALEFRKRYGMNRQGSQKNWRYFFVLTFADRFMFTFLSSFSAGKSFS
jgi:hypothetical protein